MKKTIAILATVATIGATALSAPAKAHWIGFGPGPAFGLAAGAIAAGVAGAYGPYYYGPGCYGYYGPRYYGYYGPAYYGPGPYAYYGGPYYLRWTVLPSPLLASSLLVTNVADHEKARSIAPGFLPAVA
jgi:hypothetical protein